MSKHLVPRFWPAPMATDRHGRNGAIPTSGHMRRLAQGFNFVSTRQKRQLLMKSRLLKNVDVAMPLFYDQWPFFFRSGENTSGIRISIGQALVGTGVGGSISIRRFSDLVLIDQIDLNYNGLRATSEVAPSDIHHGTYTLTGLAANTEYYVTTTLFVDARIVYMTAVEMAGGIGFLGIADDADEGVCNPGAFLDEAPIYDAHISDLVNASNSLWKHNGAQLLHWSAENETDSPVISAASYTNVVDGSTAVSSTSAGVNLFTQYHNTENRTTIPVRFAAKAHLLTGAGTFDVRLTDGTNNIDLNVASGWAVATASVPPQAGVKWDIQAKVTSGTWRLDAVCLQEYEI